MSEAGSPSSGDGRSNQSDAPRIRRRNRMITSCLECRRRKLKCDKLHPCTNCSKFSRDCMFLAPALDSVSQKKLNELKDKMGSLEKVLENDIARKSSDRHPSPTRHAPGDLPGEESGDDGEVVIPEDEKPLEPTALAVTDAAYEDTASEDLLDLGVWVGRIRLTERFGGTFRPRFPEEVGSTLGEPINTDMADQSVKRLTDHEDFLAPGPTYIAPGAGFILGDVGSRRNLIDFLPSKQVADGLVQKYYLQVHFIARVLHWPSFQLQYESFWNNIWSGYEPQPSLQAVVFGVLFSAVVSMDDADIHTMFGNSKPVILETFQTATEVSLGKAHVLRTSKIETLQAFVLYLIPMIRDDISRAHSVLVGTAIRLAECMGLHRDPEMFGMSPIGTHVRRMLWFQLCYLDFKTAEAQAPRMSIKREDYDTKLPLDINDLDLVSSEPKERSGVWTDMTLSRLRFECAEMLRVVSGDVERLRLKSVSLTSALGRVESFRRAMEAKYHPMIDEKVSIQAFAKKLLHGAMSRMHVAVLHRFHHSVHVKIPDRLREVLIMGAIGTMETFITLQQAPEFYKWRWISTSILTWNPAMLLLLEIFVYPQSREIDRMWAIVDYTFSPDPTLPRDQKIRQVLRTIRDRLAYYRDMKRVREPVDMPLRQALAVRMKEQRTEQRQGPVSINSILLKQEETDISPRDIPRTTSVSNGSSSRKQSLNDQPFQIVTNVNPPSVSQSETDTWSFDSSSTLFLGRSTVRPVPGRIQSSSHSSVSPVSGITNLFPRQNIAAQPLHPISSHESASSSTCSPSNTDAWPPPTTSEAQSWTLQQQQHDPSVEQRLAATPPLNSQLSNMFMSQNFSLGQTPFVNGGPPNIEAILQPADPGYVQEDSMLLDIDWGEWDKIFPPEMNTGNIN